MVNMEVSNKGMTVDQLWQLCVNMRKEGYGKKHIMISADDECNSFHSLWSGFEVDQKEINEWRSCSGFENSSVGADELVLLM